MPDGTRMEGGSVAGSIAVFHVLCVVHWIGGVAFVTLIALPLARSNEDARDGMAKRG
jgi:uncharacterized membrane protein